MFDLLIKNGTVIDGTGADRARLDVGVTGGRIAALGPDLGAEAREIVDATGLLVTPGFVDVHTHYDGQVTWDDSILPSAAHGVTTIVLGNCGVGFAPVRPGSEDWLIGLMEGVEDIPGTALHDGIQWSWESFPEYLDALGERRYALDVAAQVPHGALRAYVMGERGAADEPATEDDLRSMAELVRAAIEAGAVGFSSSRTAIHQATDGRPVPGTRAVADELLVIGHAMGSVGGGVFELVPGGRGIPGIDDPWTMPQELELIRRFADETQRPVTFSVGQTVAAPHVIDDVLAAADTTLASSDVRLQFSGRSGGVLSSLQTCHALQRRPTLVALSHLPLDQQVQQLRDPEIKARVLAEDDLPPASPAFADRFDGFLRHHLDVMYPLGDPPDYEPDPSTSIAHRAEREGRDPLDVVYDAMLEDDGRAMLAALTTNYVAGDLSVIETLLQHPKTVLGLGDGGAHVRYLCDASIPTFVLAHWGRDRTRGRRLPLELLVEKQAAEPARLYGFGDRGTIEVGKRADLNVIDFGRLGLGAPYITADLPGGAQRLLQRATGYVVTLVNGVVTRRNDEDTGARPGRLARRHVA